MRCPIKFSGIRTPKPKRFPTGRKCFLNRVALCSSPYRMFNPEDVLVGKSSSYFCSNLNRRGNLCCEEGNTKHCPNMGTHGRIINVEYAKTQTKSKCVITSQVKSITNHTIRINFLFRKISNSVSSKLFRKFGHQVDRVVK